MQYPTVHSSVIINSALILQMWGFKWLLW